MWEGNTKNEEAMGKNGFGRRNLERWTVVDYAKRWKQVVSSIMLVKRSTQRVAYSSGGSNTQVDILARRGRLKKV